MTVLGILGVLAAIAFPAISDLAASRAAATEVNKVKVALDTIRDRARQSLRCFHVTRTSSSQLQVDELQSSATGCGTTVVSTTVRDFNPAAVELTSNVDLTFNRNGSLDGVTASYVDLVVSQKRHGHPNAPTTIRVFRVLGLVRRL